MCTFNNYSLSEYREIILKDISDYQAELWLEREIAKAETVKAIELRKQRSPAKILQMEHANLKAAGFDLNKLSPSGEEEALILAYRAAYEQAKKYWPELADIYDVKNYKLSPETELIYD